MIRRGETSGFANWGGAITFDASGTVWHFNHNTAPTAGTNDFLSVAIHEMGHALGLGASDEWSELASGGAFPGAVAAAEYGSAPPLEPPIARRPLGLRHDEPNLWHEHAAGGGHGSGDHDRHAEAAHVTRCRGARRHRLERQRTAAANVSTR